LEKKPQHEVNVGGGRKEVLTKGSVPRRGRTLFLFILFPPFYQKAQQRRFKEPKRVQVEKSGIWGHLNVPGFSLLCRIFNFQKPSAY